MKTHNAQQEILLMTGTSFSSRTWCANDEAEDKNNNTPEDRLKEACWNGLLPEILPEICTPTDGKQKLFLWQITQGSSFIDIEMGEVPGTTEKYFSVNPYYFLDVQFYS